jgi:uncharacterized membrane protein YeiB
MLLLIALANAAGVALGGPGVAPDPAGVDRILNLLLNTFVHARAYPVFAIMFGYGLVQIATRQAAAGAPARAVRSLLLRRHLWLVAFGFVHASLLYFGDFLAAYGLCSRRSRLRRSRADPTGRRRRPRRPSPRSSRRPTSRRCAPGWSNGRRTPRRSWAPS